MSCARDFISEELPPVETEILFTLFHIWWWTDFAESNGKDGNRETCPQIVFWVTQFTVTIFQGSA